MLVERYRPLGGIASLWLALTLAPELARGETLADAMLSAAEHHPALAAQRARLSAAREDVTIARAGYFPKLHANADATRSNTPPGSLPASANPPDPRFKSYSYGLSAEQPLFDGLKTVHAVDEATEATRAGEQDLRKFEQATLGEAVTAYLDLLRDLTIVQLREHSVAQLERELSASRSRLENGDATRTDVAQSAARLSTAIGNHAVARGNEVATFETFRHAVGRPPSSLQPAPLPAGFPSTLDQALAIATVEDPSLIAATHRLEASRLATRKIAAEALPRVSMHADYSRAVYDSASLGTANDASVGVRVVVPLFDGGETSARMRQSYFLEASRDQELRDARSRSRSNVAAIWARLDAARRQVVATRAAVEANRTALSGVREERKFSQRTTLDVLNSEQEVTETLVRLAQAEHEVLQLAYNLMQAIGRLSLDDIVTTPRSTATDQTRRDKLPPVIGSTAATVPSGWRTTITK